MPRKKLTVTEFKEEIKKVTKEITKLQMRKSLLVKRAYEYYGIDKPKPAKYFSYQKERKLVSVWYTIAEEDFKSVQEHIEKKGINLSTFSRYAILSFIKNN